MCKIIVINELVLGQRPLGFEVLSLPKGEILEYTHKQLKDLLTKSDKNEVYGVKVSEETGELIPDENFFCTNWMKKAHIGSLVPAFDSETMVNLFYVVIGSHKEKNTIAYDVISSRFERTSFSEEKVRTLLEMGIISAGAKLGTHGEVILASLEKPKAEKKEEKAEKKEEAAP